MRHRNLIGSSTEVLHGLELKTVGKQAGEPFGALFNWFPAELLCLAKYLTLLQIRRMVQGYG